MYKKITHEIVEEHFDHPAVLPAGMCDTGTYATSYYNTGTYLKPMFPNYVVGLEPLPTAVINEKTLIFRMDSRTLWTRYSLGMINYSVSDFGGLESTPFVERNLAKAAAQIGDYFIPYYGITAGTKIGSLLVVISKNGTEVVKAIRNKRDIDVFKGIWEKQIYELANYLHEINPAQYPRDLIAEMMTNLTKFWTEDFYARFAKDFTADSIALDNILKVAVIGIPDHANKGYSSIADILSRGVIAQFPLSFVN